MSAAAAMGEAWAHRAGGFRCVAEGRRAASLAEKGLAGTPDLARLFGATAGGASFGASAGPKSPARTAYRQTGAAVGVAEAGQGAATASGPKAVTGSAAARVDAGGGRPGPRLRLTMLGGIPAPVKISRQSVEFSRPGIASPIGGMAPAALSPFGLQRDRQAAPVGPENRLGTRLATAGVTQTVRREAAAAAPSLTARCEARGAAAISPGASAGRQAGPVWTPDYGSPRTEQTPVLPGRTVESGNSARDGGPQAGDIQQATAPAQDPGEDARNGGGPTQGDVYLDGALMGRWMARILAAEAARPASGGTAFDPRRNAFPAGAMIGG